MKLTVWGQCNFSHPHSPIQIFFSKEGKKRLKLIKELHRGKTPQNISKECYCSEEELQKDLDLLEKSSFIHKKNGTYLPSFFVVLKEELSLIEMTIEEIAHGLISPVEDWYSEIYNYYRQMSFHPLFSWEEVSLLFVGNFLYEMGREQISNKGEYQLLCPPPARSSGNFYLWALEGPALKHMGTYNNHTDRFNGYVVGTYGRDTNSQLRDALPDGGYQLMKKIGREKTLTLIEQSLLAYENLYYQGILPDEELVPVLENFLLMDRGKTPLVPLGEEKDCELIDKLRLNLGEKIGTAFDNYYSLLMETFLLFPGSNYSSFSEFYCWFYNLLISHSIEVLMEKNLITLPPRGYIPYILKERKH